jgi:16S rRNA processing protein RimM
MVIMSQIVLGYIARAFGIKGGVVIRLLNEESSSFSVGLKVSAKLGKVAPRSLTISSIMDKGRIFFEEITDRSDAESLVGAEILMDRDLLPDLAEDEYYLTDMIGAQIVDTEGTLIGLLVDYGSNNAQTLLEIETIDQKSASIPLVKPIVCKIDCENKIIVVDLPEGLLELD